MKTLNPEDFKTECTTVWSFPKRGDWATHNPKYRGNVPEIRICKPVEEIPEIGIKKSIPMFNFAKEGKINFLDFINDKTNFR